MPSVAFRVVRLGVILAAWGAAPVAAHDFTPGVLSLVERETGRFEYRWVAPIDSGEPIEVGFAMPRPCRRTERWIDCGRAGLAGEIRFPGLRDHRARVIVIVDPLDGPPREHLVSGDAPHLSLARRAESSFRAWLQLGVEHIALGLDHLAFLIGLLLVVGVDRRAIAVVTAFTLAHSLTLGLAALDVVRLAAAPVEATIAASVVLVARESLHEEPTLTRRLPWLVAGIFGLVHGLGFAGALREIGLPEGAELVPLLAFNLGVELGQLALVAVALGVARLAARSPTLGARSRRLAAYAIGSLGVAWLAGRLLAMLTASPAPW